MSIVDPGAEQAGQFWTRHNVSDHDDASTGNAWHLSDMAYNQVTGKWSYGGAFGVPTATAGANAGTSAPVPVVGAGSTDDRGAITFGTGSSPGAATSAAQALVNVVFANQLLLSASRTIYVDLQETNSATRNLFLIPTVTTGLVNGATVVTGFTVSYCTGTIAASQANTTYAFIYKVES